MTKKTTDFARWLSATALAGLLAAAAYAAAAPDEAAPNDNAKDEVFVPTEDISEDFAVPFPVDI